MTLDVTIRAPLDLIQLDMTEVQIVDPASGESKPLHAVETDVLARVLGMVQASIDDHLRALYDAKRVLGDEVIARMDRKASWTVRAAGVEIIAPSPSAGKIDWNAEKLEEILGVLVEEKLIDREAKLRAVWPDTVYKTDKRAITALLKIPGVEERIAEARIIHPTGERKASVRVDRRHL